jgi:hypothetical protein
VAKLSRLHQPIGILFISLCKDVFRLLLCFVFGQVVDRHRSCGQPR